MIYLKAAIVVEGRYDIHKVKRLFDAPVIETRGFGIFKDGEKMALLRRLAEADGIVVLTDPDGAGLVIRNRIRGAVQSGRVYHAYVPDIYGKERRKSAPGKEGKLGVEGICDDVIVEAVRRSGVPMPDGQAPARARITKADLYALGLSGGRNSAQKRAEFMRALQLPENLSANALLDVLGALISPDELQRMAEKL